MIKIVAVLVLLTLSLGTVGCQERVVSTRNDWIGSQYNPVEERPLEREKGFGEKVGDSLSDTGEFLFGWTGLTGKKRSSPKPFVTEVEPAERMSRPQQRASGGSDYY